MHVEKRGALKVSWSTVYLYTVVELDNDMKVLTSLGLVCGRRRSPGICVTVGFMAHL